MDDGWIKETIERLKDLYQRNANEKAISSYIISVIRLLNGMAQIMHGGFHRYEQIILGNSVKLFCEHFQEQVQCAVDDRNDAREKNEIIRDIEDAVIQIAQVYKNAVDGTANADRRMFMSLSIDTSLYEFSPKLCALYAHMLERLVQLYAGSGTGQQEYAFLIHPTLESNIKSKVLFKKRENSGKVVVVYIPVSILDKTDLVPVIALHEAFHVLTKKERGRQRRSVPFIEAALYGIEKRLFKGITLCAEDKELDGNRKKELMKIWFGQIQDDFTELCKVKGEDDRCWYSENLINSVKTALLKGLVMANEYLLQGGLAEIYMRDSGDGFRKCVEEYETMRKNSERISNNLYPVITGNALYEILERCMSILREAYADIACIVTARLKPELYDNAFAHSIQLDISTGEYMDEDGKMRKRLVYDTIIANADAELSQMWNEHKQEMQFEFGKSQNFCENMLETTGQKASANGIMKPIYMEYYAYLAECFRRLETINKHPSIEQFRRDLKNILEKQEDVLFAVLGGNFEMNIGAEENG